MVLVHHFQPEYRFENWLNNLKFDFLPHLETVTSYEGMLNTKIVLLDNTFDLRYNIMYFYIRVFFNTLVLIHPKYVVAGGPKTW